MTSELPRPHLTIVVPARNEQSRLPRLLDQIADEGEQAVAEAGFALAAVIVVDDGSSDETTATVSAYDRLPWLSVIPARGGRGKGAAVRTGVLATETSWALVVDADVSTPFRELVALAAAAASGADIAIASRGLPASCIVVHQPAYREHAGKIFNRLVRLATRLPYTDTQCGFKLYRVAAVRTLFEEQRTMGFAYDVENLLAARRLGLRVAEVPVQWSNDVQTRVPFFRASLAMAYDLGRIVLRHHARRSVGRRRALAHDSHS